MMLDPMDVSVVGAPAMAALAGIGGPIVARHGRPAAVVRLLPIAALATAVGTAFSLAVIALYFLAHTAQLARIGRWSADAIPYPGDLPWSAGVPIALLVFTLLTAAVLHTVRALGRLWAANSACRYLAPGTRTDGPVIVVDDVPDAYAVPGVRGRVVISTAMVAALTESEREALLAHEMSHLAHRHHLWIQLSEIAAAANPLLRRIPATVRYAAERWADEDAAIGVHDRALTAHAIAHAAIARTTALRVPDPPRSVGLDATGGDVPGRVRALLRPPRPRYAGIAATTVTVLVIAVATVATAATAEFTHCTFIHARTVDASGPDASGTDASGTSELR
jgi:Zn-dependent protease with chaperone function